MGVPASLKLGQRLRPTPYSVPRLLPEGVSSFARGRKEAWPAALTDLSTAPGVLGAAVQDVREKLRVEAGGGPLLLQVLVHGDGQQRQRRPRRRAAATASVRTSSAGPALRASPGHRESPPPFASSRPGPPFLLHRGPSARDRPWPRRRRRRGGRVPCSRPGEPLSGPRQGDPGRRSRNCPGEKAKRYPQPTPPSSRGHAGRKEGTQGQEAQKGSRVVGKGRDNEAEDDCACASGRGGWGGPAASGPRRFRVRALRHPRE